MSVAARQGRHDGIDTRHRWDSGEIRINDGDVAVSGGRPDLDATRRIEIRAGDGDDVVEVDARLGLEATVTLGGGEVTVS